MYFLEGREENKMQKSELLEDILKESQLQYISDLKNGLGLDGVRKSLQFLMKTRREEYKVSEWQETISYITRGNVQPQSMEEIEKYIQSL